MLKVLWKRGIHILKGMLLIVPFGCAQTIPADKPPLQNPEFDSRLQTLLSFSVPLISVSELHAQKEKVFILDAREEEEYKTSHIDGARYIGYRNLNERALNNIPKEAKIVLYCSVGYRSEKIGKRLQHKGFTNVYNLYGSIFEWVNQGYPVVDQEGNITQNIHTYNKNWSKWVNHPKVKKMW